MGDFDDAETVVSPSAPLVDFGQTAEESGPSEPAELEEVTKETDMSTMPSARPGGRDLDEFCARLVAKGHAPVRVQAMLDALEGRRPDEARSLASSPPRGDLKAGLTSDRPRLTIVPGDAELHEVRAMEYGADKYRRGNYHGSPPAALVEQLGDRRARHARVLGYMDAAMRHLRAVAHAYNRAFGDEDAELDALRVTDDKASAGFPPSGLPHLSHARASVSLAIQCAVDDGILPEDPGQPWRGGKVREERSPEAAARFSDVGNVVDRQTYDASDRKLDD